VTGEAGHRPCHVCEPIQGTGMSCQN